jgi:hypothetical protein
MKAFSDFLVVVKAKDAPGGIHSPNSAFSREIPAGLNLDFNNAATDKNLKRVGLHAMLLENESFSPGETFARLITRRFVFL